MKNAGAKAFLILFVVISAVLTLLLVQEKTKSEADPIDVDALKVEREQRLTEQSAFFSMLEADEWVMFEADYTRAEKLLTDLIEVAPELLKPRVEQRLLHLKGMMNERNSNDSSFNEKESVIKRLRERIDHFTSEIDSLRSVFVNRNDSLQDLLAAAKAEITKKNNELKQKDKVQVISFAGSKGVKVHYMGEVSHGKANGGGIGIWTTGSVYRGEWKDNLRHGKGTFEWADGERYEGDYLEGRREGDGTYYWPSGERYEGQWVSDRRTGQGTLFDLDGNVRYEGAWKDDKPLTK